MSYSSIRKSLSTCEVHQGFLMAQEHASWKLSENASTTEIPPTATTAITEERLSCHYLRSGTVLQVMPIEYEFGGWSEEHFHHDLRLPVECHVGKGVVCLFEGELDFGGVYSKIVPIENEDYIHFFIMILRDGLL